VLDVSDPRHPVKTDYITARATRNAGESLRVNRRIDRPTPVFGLEPV